MKKLLYTIALVSTVITLRAQGPDGLIFSWSGSFHDFSPLDHDSVRIFVQNTSPNDIYLLGFNAKVYYHNANIQGNANFTMTNALLSAGFVNISTANATVTEFTMQGSPYNRFVGVAPFVDYSSVDGLYLPGQGPEPGLNPQSQSVAAPVKLGTFRFLAIDNGNMGGSGCIVTPSFEAAQTYTTSTELTASFGQDPVGPCAGGCAVMYEGQLPIPEQGSQCCAACGLLAQSPLPLDLIAFMAEKYQGTSSRLFWQTANEENVSHFEVERSMDGLTWNLVSKVAANGSASQTLNSYAMVDRDVYDGRSLNVKVYYRLRILDRDGAFKYSKIQVVRFYGESGAFTANVFPNPSTDGVTVELNYGTDGTIATQLTVFNNLGQLVYTQEIPFSADQVYVDHVKAGLSAGSYTLKIMDADHNTLTQEKMIIQR